MRLLPVKIILVSPKYEKNVGAVFRLAANFEVESVVLVDPRVDLLDKEILSLSREPSEKYVKEVKIVKTLKEALKDSKRSVAFSGLYSDWNKLGEKPLEHCGHLIREQEKPIYLVFGREDSGLTQEELLLCNFVVRLKTSQLQPSLNLSHAVAVVLHFLYERVAEVENSQLSDPMKMELQKISSEEFEKFILILETKLRDRNLANVDFLLKNLRRTFHKAELTAKEVAVLNVVLS
jgi:tRNA/rRNA methyltransferase